MNFQKLFTDYKIDYSTKTNKGWINTKCIYCGGNSYKLGFNPVENYCTCFACGFHPLKETLSKILNLSKYELNEIIPEYETRIIQLRELKEEKKTVNKLKLPTDTFTSIERKYLKKRNFNPSYLNKKYNIVGGGIVGDWKYRIIIPLILNGQIVSWTARSILPKNKLDELKIPRYKNLSINESIIDVKSTLFNLDNCKSDKVILTEGAFDVLRLSYLDENKQFSDNVICSFGIELTQTQIGIIADRFKKVFILFDNEIQAQKTARKFGVQLSAMGVDVEIVDAYSDFGVNDGAELTNEQVKIIRKELFDE